MYTSRPPATQQTAHLRLTHAERDEVVDLLKEAFSEGQLDENEFEERVDTAMKAKVRNELDPLLHDLRVERPETAAAPMEQEEDPSSTERAWAVGGHLSGYFIFCVGPLVALLVNGRSAFVRRHALEALNYQLFFLIASFLVVPIAIVTLGIGLIVYLFMLLGWLILPIVASIAAARGSGWKYPLTWRPIKNGPRLPK